MLELMDWAAIYDVDPLYGRGLDGTGQSIAVVGSVDLRLSDVRTFRSNAGLAPNGPVVIYNGANPGFVNWNDEFESERIRPAHPPGEGQA
jgi:subtilase family serine protease